MIAVTGEALIDIVAGQDGRLVARPGGGPFNTARTIGRLGLSPVFLGRLSADRFGRLLRASLDADGVTLAVPSWPASPPRSPSPRSARTDRRRTASTWMAPPPPNWSTRPSPGRFPAA